jgi:Kef-type K+ transport system membrane component KefB
MDVDRLDTQPGHVIVTAALLEDVFSLVLLAVLTAVARTGEFPDAVGLVRLLAQVAVFFLVTWGVGHYVYPWVGPRLTRWKSEEFEFTGLLVAALALATLAELLGLHFILGAFMAGLFFGRQTAGSHVYKAVASKVSGVTRGVLAPIFFASIGLNLDLTAVWNVPGFLALLLLAAFATKLIGAGVPAYLMGLAPREAWAVGWVMSARGAVELITADIALRAGLFERPEPVPPIVASLFSVVVIVAIVTTLVSPVALRVLLRGEGKRRERGESG